jgi:hypothetical protein
MTTTSRCQGNDANGLTKCQHAGTIEACARGREGRLHMPGRAIPSLHIRNCRVDCFMPRRTAAPCGTLSTHFVSWSTATMCLRSASSRVSWGVARGASRRGAPARRAQARGSPPARCCSAVREYCPARGTGATLALSRPEWSQSFCAGGVRTAVRNGAPAAEYHPGAPGAQAHG